MCRCCQDCWEDFTWNCFEERFCYDESIANYNPEDDEDHIASQKNGSVLGCIHSDNNNLTVPPAICAQPLRRNWSINSNGKIHEEDYRRETQVNLPMLGPEVLAVFANSQIFQDHQPTKLSRISTKTLLTGVHSPHRQLPTTPRESDEDRLIKRLEGLCGDATDSTQRPRESTPANDVIPPSDRRITFTLTTDSSPEGSQVATPKKFEAIAEEDDGKDDDGVILRPRLIDRRPHLLMHSNSAPKKQLRNARSMPHFSVRAASETDIFSISGSGKISMTPEVPSISYSNLPKNYEDTPTIEKYKVSQSLYSIQAANASRDDYSMPRYFRRSAMIVHSSEVLGASVAASASASASREDVRRTEKSTRLQMLRSALPPLLIHSVSFRKNREDSEQLD